MSLLLFLACSGDPPAAPVAAIVPEPPAPLRRYVTASSLNLRAEGSPEAARLGVLSINSPVTVTETTGGWSSIEAANGSKGWVDARFLSEDPLTVARASEQAEASSDPAAVLSWRQRAAALSPLDRSLLISLADAYVAAGDSQQAEVIRKQLTWPEAILPVEQVRDGGEVWLLVSTSLDTGGMEPGATVPAEVAERLGLPGVGEWWVLPDIGAAVSATFTRHEYGILNECAGDYGIWTVLTLAEPLPEGRRSLVATAGEVPAAWTEDHPAPGLSAEEATAQLQAYAETQSNEEIRISLAPAGDSWLGVARWDLTEDEDFFTTSEGVFVRITAEEGVRLIRHEPELDTLALVPFAERDLDGDGRVETMWGGCEVDIHGDGGLLETATPNTCCGC